LKEHKKVQEHASAAWPVGNPAVWVGSMERMEIVMDASSLSYFSCRLSTPCGQLKNRQEGFY